MKRFSKILRIFCVILFIAVILAIIFLSFYKPILQDEGVFLTITKGIKNGLLPYKDFFDHKPPGIYLVLLPLVYLFGQKIIAYKIFLLAVNFSSTFLVYLLSEKIRNGTGLLSCSLFLFSLYVFEGYFLIAEPFMVLFILISLWLLIDTRRSSKNIFFAGIFAGLSILMKQPAILSIIVLLFFIRKKKLIYFLTGSLLPLLVVLLWFFSKNIVAPAFSQIIFANAAYSREPIAAVIEGLVQPFSATWFIWAGFLCFLFIKGKYKGLLFFLILAPLPILMIRHYPHYWIQVIPFVSISSSIFWQILNDKWKYFLLIPVFFSLIGSGRWFYWMYQNHWQEQSVEEKEAIAYVRSQKVDYIFAENRFTSFYFFSNESNLSRFLYLGEINDTEKAVPIILERLKNEDDVLVLWPNDKNVYAIEIDKYIKSAFRKERTFSALSLDIYSKI